MKRSAVAARKALHGLLERLAAVDGAPQGDFHRWWRSFVELLFTSLRVHVHPAVILSAGVVDRQEVAIREGGGENGRATPSLPGVGGGIDRQGEVSEVC